MGLMGMTDALLPPEAARQWRAQVAFKQAALQPLHQSGLSPEQSRDEPTRVAKAWLDALREAEAKPSNATRPAGKRPSKDAAATAGEPAKKPRPAAVGRLKGQFTDAEPVMRAPIEGTAIREWRPARAARLGRSSAIPRRAETYRPTEWQQVQQLRRVRQWQPRRLLKQDDDDRYFTIAKLSKVEGKWRRKGGAGTIPIGLLREAIPAGRAIDVLAASEGYHLWSVRDVAPFDAAQCTALMTASTPEVGGHLAAMLRERWEWRPGHALTESKVRSLFGQGTHDATTALILERAAARCGGAKAMLGRDPPSIGEAGSGMGLMGIQAAAVIDGWTKGTRTTPCSIKWMADACPIAGPVGIELARRMGHDPRHFKWAEEPELETTEWRTTVELVTLRCAPFSPANAKYPEGVEAAFAEAACVFQGVARRRPRVVIMENTAGLWRHEADRARYESLLGVFGAYAFEVAKLSPHWHADSDAKRARVFYVGVAL